MPERPLGPRTTRKAIPIVPFHPVTDAHVREVRLGAGSPNLIWRQVLDCDADALAGLCTAMKFRPFGNDFPPSQWPNPGSGKEIDEKLDAFYEKCVELEVPVMGHANNSRGRDNAGDALSDPSGWAAAVGRHPALRVDLGHFGGDDGKWISRYVTEVMKKGKHVYADLGYRVHLQDPKSPASRELGKQLAVSLGADGSVADRVLYGSDWHMISQVADWHEYADRLADSIRSNSSAAVADKVLGANAMECFGLNGNGANRRRLEELYKKRGAPLPRWLAAAAAA